MEGSRGHVQREAAVRQRSHKHNTNGVQPTTQYSNQLQFSMDTHETVNQQLASFATKKNMYRGTHLSENEVKSSRAQSLGAGELRTRELHVGCGTQIG